MRILVVGAGAVGGYFGARLVQAGRDVTFLVRPQRAEQLRRDGLQIVSPHGDATLHPTLITAAEIDGAYDVVLLSVKSFGLDAAIADFAPAVGARTMILPVLNGLRHMDVLRERFGADPVLGGVCLVMTQIEQDRIVQFAEVQKLIYGEVDGSVTERVYALDAAMRGAGFDAELSTAIMPAMWRKWVQLASLGGINCLFRGPIGAVVAVPGGADLNRAIIQECVEIATACGFPPAPDFLAQHTALLTKENSPMTSSMFRDLRAGAQVEVEAIVGDMLARGRGHGITAPLLTAAYVNLRVYQGTLSGR